MLAPVAQAQDALAELEPLSGEELGELRGGLLFAGGIAFDFGAVVRTSIDGQLALETRLTWTPGGVVMEDASPMTPGPLPEFGGFGLNITDESGTTLVGHRLLEGELQGFILNTGDNRDIRQDIDITLTLPGFEATQRDMLTGRLGFHIQADMADALTRSSLD
jgi:hypothetical protein